MGSAAIPSWYCWANVPVRMIALNSPYSFSFISGALYLSESLAVARLLSELGDWDQVSRAASVQNVLRQRTQASQVRILREIRYRLEAYTPKEIQFLLQASQSDQRLMLFVAVCERFRFIREFVLEVLETKFQRLDHPLRASDFNIFFDRKGMEAAEVEALSDKSRAKIRQVMIRMLAEAGFLNNTTSKLLQRPIPGKELARLWAHASPGRFRFLLVSNADLHHLTS